MVVYTTMYLEYHVYSFGVALVFLVLAGNSFCVTYVLSVQYSCAVVSFFLIKTNTNPLVQLQLKLIHIRYI